MTLLLGPLPTAVLLRLYRKWAALEDQLRSATDDVYDVDAYDKVADRAASAYMILRDRGVDLCPYCRTEDGTHPSSRCPETLLRSIRHARS